MWIFWILNVRFLKDIDLLKRFFSYKCFDSSIFWEIHIEYQLVSIQNSPQKKGSWEQKKDGGRVLMLKTKNLHHLQIQKKPTFGVLDQVYLVINFWKEIYKNCKVHKEVESITSKIRSNYKKLFLMTLESQKFYPHA